MSKNIRIIYLYLVSGITLMLAFVGFVGIVTNVVTYHYPVVDNYDMGYSYTEMTEKEDMQVEMPQEEALANYQKEYEATKKIAKNNALRNAFEASALFVVATPLYAYHYLKTLKEGEE